MTSYSSLFGTRRKKKLTGSQTTGDTFSLDVNGQQYGFWTVLEWSGGRVGMTSDGVLAGESEKGMIDH